MNKDGTRKTRTAILSIARKNGKTALIAALVLVHLVGPEAQINSEIVSAANDKDQAGQVYKYAKQIIELSPTLMGLLRCIDGRKRIVYDKAGSFYAALSADANRKHGLNPIIVIYDELAQSKNRELFDALETAQGAQEEPLFITISTQSNDPQHPLSIMIDDGLSGEDDTIVVHLYEVPEDVEDIFDESEWIGANPALGDFRSIIEFRKYAAKAKRLPSFENTFRNLYCNQRVSTLSTLFTPSVWKACAGDASLVDGERVYLGLDLATKIDLAALAVLSEDGMRLHAKFWKPEDLMAEHGKRDRVDYRAWQKQGYLEPCPGKVIDTDLIANTIGEIHKRYEIVGLAYDRWRIDSLIKALDEVQLDAGTDESNAIMLVPWGQGFTSMSPAIDAFEEAVIDEKLTHDANPLLTWNVANAVVVSDPAGNRKLDKAKSRLRIDGAQAASMACGLHDRMMKDPPKPSVYEERGLRRL